MVARFCLRLSMLACVFATHLTVPQATDAEPPQVFSESNPLTDVRLEPLRNLRDEYHSWVPPTTIDGWQKTQQQIREQVLVAAGLWPLPEKTPLEPVIHGAIDRGDYVVEKVYFASMPGHYMAGNLYRPKEISGKVPGVLCPHGHWANGRFYDAGDKAQAELDSGAESFESGARYPLQARFVQLARMGCIVFHYDMLGYADSKPLDHRVGMDDVQSILWQNNKLGLQTWNSIRALDFLVTLDEVDPDRLAVTGASGGGTQTMLLGAVDDRVAVQFPAVMVSTGMQGGCICENAALLRVGLNNVSFAAAFAPRAQKMSGADDWTVAIETKGLPELKQVYSLYGKSNLVDARALTQFKHNYNEPSRELMYNWFNEHLDLGLESPVEQTDFEPIPPEQLSVFDKEHPLPADALSDADLQKEMTAQSKQQFAELVTMGKSDLGEYQQVVGTAARVMLGEFPDASTITSKTIGEQNLTDAKLFYGAARRETGEVIPWYVIVPRGADGTTALWVDGKGKGHLLDDSDQPTEAVQQLLNDGVTVVSIDLFGTGEFPASAVEDRQAAQADGYPGFHLCYNRPLLAERVRDVATALSSLAALDEVSKVHLIGTGGAGPAVLLARAITPADVVDRTIVDLEGASFQNVTKASDPLLLPAALKYGGFGGLSALALPGKLTIHGVNEQQRSEFDPLIKIAGTEGSVDVSVDQLERGTIARQLASPGR